MFTICRINHTYTPVRNTCNFVEGLDLRGKEMCFKSHFAIKFIEHQLIQHTSSDCKKCHESITVKLSKSNNNLRQLSLANMSIKLYIEMMSVLRYIMEIKALYFINIENAKQGGIVWILFQNRSRWITGGKQNTNI